MAFEYDIAVVGLGPAGMAVSIMGSEMGLKVCAIEKHKIGGECMNVGCIPSKALLKIAEKRAIFRELDRFELSPSPTPEVLNPFTRIQNHLRFINEKKTAGMFKKVDLLLQQGHAEFTDPHTLQVGARKITAKRIFIATGTVPMVPPIPGINDIDYYTNVTLFSMSRLPSSMIVIGGGAIGSEMAQAFSRLGTTCSIVHLDPYLVPVGEKDAAELLQAQFAKEGISVYNSKKISRIAKEGELIALYTDDSLRITGETVLVAAGRKIDLTALKLKNAGVQYDKRGIIVDSHLRTNVKHISAVGDCNGQFLLSHAAMHQGMLALMNTISWPFKFNFRKYPVPWTVFTDPEISHVGLTSKQLDTLGKKYETVTARYEDYGAAIAEGYGEGYVRVYVSKTGRILGASIVGPGSGEMINEWALAIQKKLHIHDIMLTMHSFPTMGFLSKRVAEVWATDKMKMALIGRLTRLLFKLVP